MKHTILPLSPAKLPLAELSVKLVKKEPMAAIDDLPIGLKPPSAINGDEPNTPTRPPRMPAALSTPNQTVIHHTPTGRLGLAHSLTPISNEDILATPGPDTNVSALPPPLLEDKMKKLDLGFLSLLISAAHNAMTSHSTDEDASHKDHHETLFTNRLENLLKPTTPAVVHEEAGLLDKAVLAEDELTRGEEETIGSKTTALAVHFNSIRTSPLNTLGVGELTLQAFDKQHQLLLTPVVPVSLNHSRRNHTQSPNRDHTRNLLATSAGRGSIQHSLTTSVALAEKLKLENVSEEEDEADSVGGGSDDGGDHPRKGSLNRRNREFHHAFKLIPASEKLIDNFSCALSKDILVHGRMFLLENYICFNLNILGFVTHLVIPLREVIKIEKKSTAVLFPNGVVIKTLHQRYVFATFLSRDHTFRVIKRTWNNVLAKNGDARTARARAGRLLVNSSLLEESDTDYESDVSLVMEARDVESEEEDMVSDDEPKPKPKGESSESGDSNTWNGFPLVGPVTHAPTDNGYTKQQGDTFIADETFKAPVGVVFNLLFGSDTSSQRQLLEKGKNFDITDIHGLSKDHKERDYLYIKPLNGPIGPKQTQCIIHDKILDFNPEKVIVIQLTTNTPDVPLGNSFTVRLTVYFSWAEANLTRMYVVTAVDWLGKLWIKGAIEKGLIDGQKESLKQILEFLTDAFANGKRSSPSKKKKTTRSRHNTTVEKIEPKLAPPPPEKSLMEKIADVIDLVGKLVPIPMVPSFVVGVVVCIFLFFVSVTIVNKIFGGGGGGGHQQVIQVIPRESFILRVKINDGEFYVIPTVDTVLNDSQRRSLQQEELWQWMENRLKNRLHVTRESTEKEMNGKERVLEEVIEQTGKRLQQLQQQLKEQRGG